MVVDYQRDANILGDVAGLKPGPMLHHLSFNRKYN
jgi:hypothetical protein